MDLPGGPAYLSDLSGSIAGKTGKLSTDRASDYQRIHTMLRDSNTCTFIFKVCVQMPEEFRRGTGYPGTGVTGS